MARAKSQRDFSTIPSEPLLDVLSEPVGPSLSVDPLLDDPLLAFEDRRQYHPAGPSRPAMMFGASDVISYPVNYASNVARNFVYDVSGKRYVDKAKNLAGAALAFRDPARVAVCVRRKIRREVLFALSPHRRIGSGRGKRRRQNWASAIRC